MNPKGYGYDFVRFCKKKGGFEQSEWSPVEQTCILKSKGLCNYNEKFLGAD